MFFFVLVSYAFMLWYSYYANMVILLLDVKFKIFVFEFGNI